MTIGVNSYKVFAVNENQLHNSTWANSTSHFDYSGTVDICKANSTDVEGQCSDPIQPVSGTPVVKNDPYLANLLHLAAKGNLTRLSSHACKEAYASELQSKHRSLLLVSSEVGSVPVGVELNETVSLRDNGDSFAWMCGNVDRTRDCMTYIRFHMREEWKPFDLKVDYCLAEEMDASCLLQFGTIPLVVVMCMNISKFFLMLLVLRTTRQSPLLNIGDAVASFIEREDEYTKGMCLASKLYIDTTLQSEYIQAVTYKKKQPQWFRATSTQRLYLCVIL
jgi:hypothetical protein